MRIGDFLVLGVVAAVCAGAANTPTRVLFVGNSLTTANDLPSRVRDLSAAAGDRWETTVVAYPNYSLEDHWQRRDASRAIGRGGWTFVVLQQGPSALAESRVLLVDYARRFDAQIQDVHARTALYMVWPANQRRVDFPGVSASYAAAANAVGGTLLPVGDAWQAAWRDDPRLPLYGDDGFHPSPLASMLAASVIYECLSRTTVSRLPPQWSVPADPSRVILKAARQVCAR